MSPAPADPTEITATVRAEVDLSMVRQLASGEDGRLVGISYQHDNFYPQSDVVVHFELPNGQVVITTPDDDGGFDLRWRDNNELVESIDECAYEVVHQMWDALNALIKTTLRQQFVERVTQALATALIGGERR